MTGELFNCDYQPYMERDFCHRSIFYQDDRIFNHGKDLREQRSLSFYELLQWLLFIQWVIGYAVQLLWDFTIGNKLSRLLDDLSELPSVVGFYEKPTKVLVKRCASWIRCISGTRLIATHIFVKVGNCLTCVVQLLLLQAVLQTDYFFWQLPVVQGWFNEKVRLDYAIFPDEAYCYYSQPVKGGFMPIEPKCSLLLMSFF